MMQHNPDPQKIAYIPMEDVGNAYTLRMREILSSFGNVERYEGIKAWLLRLLKGDWRRYDIVFVNWMENDFVTLRTGRIAWARTCKIMLKTALLKLSTRQAVFVRHNQYPHATRCGHERLAHWLVDRYERFFDVVLTHSGAELPACNEKRGAHRVRRYLPHPLYRRAPVLKSVNQPTTNSSTEIPQLPALPERYFLAFGRISPYKKIDQLAQAFPENQVLVVAGAIGDAAYAARLHEIHRENFIYLPGYLSEAQAQQLVAGAQGVVLAHAEANVVVSGTFFYAMSLGCPVYAVETPFLNWVAPRIDPALLTLGRDISDLCQHIARAERTSVSVSVQQALEHEFGDASIRAALAAALGLKGQVG